MASDGDGKCMRCKAKPLTEESLTCRTCGTPWHVPCLTSPPESLASTVHWECPDCSGEFDPLPEPGKGDGSDLVAAIRAIESDQSLTESEKAKKRQRLLSGKSAVVDDGEEEKKRKSSSKGRDNDILAAVGQNFKCSFCIQLAERPVTV